MSKGAPSVRDDGTVFLKGAEEQLAYERSFCFPDHVVQVLNSRTNTVHLYLKDETTICSAWRCGTPSRGNRAAEFACSHLEWSGSISSTLFCTLCYSEKGMMKMAAAPVASFDEEVSLASDVSSCDSESSESDPDPGPSFLPDALVDARQ